MFTLPPLIEEDVHEMQNALGELITRSEATLALVIDKGGFVVAANGLSDSIDATTLAALAAAAYTANQAIASLIQEPNFTSVYQQGEHLSLLVNNVDDQCLLVVVFKAHYSVGVVKYYANYTIQQVAAQLRRAQERAPGEGLDLSMLNLADPSAVFRRKQT